MSRELTVEEVAADLSLANEHDGFWAYQLSDSGTQIIAEQYGNEGQIEKTYTLTINIKENN